MPVLTLRQATGASLNEIRPESTTSLRVDLIVTVSICLFLTTSAVAARVFTKALDLKHVQLEDYAILVAAVGFLTFIGILFEAATTGQGIQALPHVLLLTNVLDILHAVVSLFIKLSILLQIGRLFIKNRNKLMYWTVPVLFVVHILAYIGIFMMHLFACLPREKISRPYLDGQCISKSGSVVASGVTNTTTDAIILILFLYGISQLNMSAKSKGGWALVTAIGTTACVMSGVAIRSGLKLEKDKNFTEAVLPVNIWPLVEITCLFIVACCSTFPRLFRYICGKPTPKRIRHRRTHARWIDTSSVHSNSSEETASKAQIVRPQRSSSNLSTKSEGALSQTSTLCDADRLEKAGVPELPANPPTYRPRTLSTYRPRNFRPASPDLSVRGTPPPTYAGTPPPTYPGSPPTSPPTSYSAFQPTKSPIIQPNSPPQKHEACNSHPVNVVATIPITRDNYRKTKVISPPTSPPTTHADIPRLTVTTVETPPMDTSGFDMSHPISRISHYSCTTAAILEILDENSPTTSPTSLKPNPQSPISPLSPTSPSFYRASIFTNFQVQQATPMSVIPVRQSIIKKPVEVKVAKYKIPAKAVRFGSVEEVC